MSANGRMSCLNGGCGILWVFISLWLGYDIDMKAFRIIMIVLMGLYVLLAVLGGAIGSFADGALLWERLQVVVVHPFVAVVLLVLAVMERPSRGMVAGVIGLVLLNVAGDVALSVAVFTGKVRGDWWLPLVFSVIPIIALPYCVVLLMMRRQV